MAGRLVLYLDQPEDKDSKPPSKYISQVSSTRSWSQLDRQEFFP